MTDPRYPPLAKFLVIPPRIGSHVSQQSNINNCTDTAIAATKNRVPHKVVGRDKGWQNINTDPFSKAYSVLSPCTTGNAETDLSRG